MAQPPPQSATGIPTRAFTPIRNPTYVYNDDDSWKPSPTPQNVLEQPPTEPKDADSA